MKTRNVHGRRSRPTTPGVAAAASILALSLLSGCEPYRVEYVQVPKFYERAMEGGVPDRIVMPDGTVRVYVVGDDDDGVRRMTGGKTFQPREELDDGSVVIRSVIPEHVLVNLLACLNNEEYDLIWEQMLSEHTKLAYAAEGQGPEEFTAFMVKHRLELARTINRMILGLPRSEVVTDNLGGGSIRMRFHPTVGEQFTFRQVTIVGEDFGLKLLMIE